MNVLNDDFLIEMVESLIISEFEENDYLIIDQQVIDVDISPDELKKVLERVLKSKSQSLKDKIALVLREGRQDLLNTVFKRAKKRHKTRMALRFIMFEQDEMGE